MDFMQAVTQNSFPICMLLLLSVISMLTISSSFSRCTMIMHWPKTKLCTAWPTSWQQHCPRFLILQLLLETACLILWLTPGLPGFLIPSWATLSQHIEPAHSECPKLIHSFSLLPLWCMFCIFYLVASFWLWLLIVLLLILKANAIKYSTTSSGPVQWVNQAGW